MEDANESTNEREVKFTCEELLEQNRSLTEELTQCRADKDFVWTLWKRLQAEKPDISSAVSMVIAREQEKAEIKDKKVLVILNEKDNNIKILEEIAADLEVQLKQSMERLSGLLVERTEWEGKISEFQKTVDKLKEENIYQQEVMKAKEFQYEAEKKENLSKIEDLERMKQELEVRFSKQEKEIDAMKVEKVSSATTMEANNVLKDKINVLEKDLELTKREHKEQVSGLQSREIQLLADTALASNQNERIQQKEAEIAALSSDLKKMKEDYTEYLGHVREQNEIIRNLQLLQDETQLVLRNQQDSHSSEVKSYKATLKELRTKCFELQSRNEALYGETETLKQSLDSQNQHSVEREMAIADLKRGLSHRLHGLDSETQTVDQDCIRCREVEDKLEDAKDEVDNLKDVVHEKGRRISSLEKVLQERRMRNLAYKETETESGTETDQSDAVEIIERFKTKIDALEKEVEDLDALLSLKDNELEETKQAHDRRLQRYKTLRENHAMVNEQLRTFEKDTTKALNDSLRRADPKTLQHENSETVWNELAFFKKQYKVLRKEREEFEEEIDKLRVKSAEGNVAMKQMELKLHEEQNECTRVKDEVNAKNNLISPSKLFSVEAQVEVLHSKVRQLERQKEVLSTENEALKQRERYYKEEITNLTDEIDNIHKNIKEKIDAEVQATDTIMELEKQANRSLDKIADSITAKVEQYIQTSPVSPRMRRSPQRSVNQLAQATQTTNSDPEEDSSSNENLLHDTKKHRRRHSAKERKGDSFSQLDGKSPAIKHKRQKADRDRSPNTATGKVLKRRHVPSLNSPSVRERTSLKVRVLSLQQQVDVLRNSKVKLSQELQERKSAYEATKTDLESANKKLDFSKTSIQRLSEELERCNLLKGEFEEELEREKKKSKRPDLSYKEVENRWKLATNESAKLSFQVKTLRGENEMLTAKQKEFQEKTIWLERQLSQKKQLLEELKEKLKEVTETSVKDKESLEEVKKKNKALTVNAEQRKQYVEDLRNRINDVSGEKLAMKQKLSDCEEELKKKSRILQQSQYLCNHAEKAVNEMEKAAFDQLHEQAMQQEKIHKKMKDDMTSINGKTQEYQWIIKSFVESILKDAHRLRVLIAERRRQKREEEAQQQNQKEAMKVARGIACSVLEMTSNDLNGFMEEELELEDVIETYDNDVREKLQIYLKQETKFSKHLLNLLLQTLDHVWSLKILEYTELHQLNSMQNPP